MGLGRVTAAAALPLLALFAASCGSSGSHPKPRPNQALAALIRERRPIGQGPRFHPRATGPTLGACRPALGRRDGVHIEVFAANRVVLIPTGIGTRPPRTYSEGRVSRARCFAALVTVDPTGVVLVRPGTSYTLADVFQSWGQPLSARRVASFAGAVTAYVDGHRWVGAPTAISLTRHAEIVVETGPHVPPHSNYTFPPGA